MTSQARSRASLELAHLWRKLTGRRRRAQAAAKRAFRAALGQLSNSDIAIDLGANVGEFTVQMAASGARVYAFEPDPHAFALLKKATAGFANVTLVEAAAGAESGETRLYRAAGFDRQPDRRTKSSSLFAEKRNVNAASGLSIRIVDFPAFVADLNADVALVKIDIEGAEVPLLEALLDSPAAARIGDIFVETHERSLPHLDARTRALKAAFAARRVPRVNWDWH